MEKDRGHIYHDALERALNDVIKNHQPKTILDVGAFNGQGSTRVFANAGIRTFAIEMREDLAKLCEETYKDNEKVFIYQASATATLIPRQNVWTQFQKHPNWDCWRSLGIHEMLKWYDNTVINIQNAEVPEGIDYIKKKHRIKNFGLVLLDGSPFSGPAELEKVWGAKIIALDDVRDIKNYQCYQTLRDSPEYELIASDMGYRNGFAIYKKK